MKKSYKKILIYQTIIFLVFILNSFISNILGGYNFTIFLLLSLIFFKILFGFEKDRHRYTKDIIFNVKCVKKTNYIHKILKKISICLPLFITFIVYTCN